MAVNWDLHLEEVHRQFIAIKYVDYKRSQDVFLAALDQVKKAMNKECQFFKKNSSQILYAGSVYDGIKVSKLDEFDMDVVINLPINYKNDIVIENDQPGFVKLKTGQAYDFLDKQENWTNCNIAIRDWRDSEKYLLQNKFRAWMHSIVNKALGKLNFKVRGVKYLLEFKESGPAYTLLIKNDKGNEEFTLDVDLVPVIRFQYPRWPNGYREVEASLVKDWLVVPKPNKAIPDDEVRNRCWRLSFQDFERDMMKGCHQLKPTIRLLKKLRDSLEIKGVASYYIKTIFLWKIVEKASDEKFWQQGLGFLFRTMVQEFYNAMENKIIPYFWQEKNNLIGHLQPKDLNVYAAKLNKVLNAFERNDIGKVVSCILNAGEMKEYKKSDFYKKHFSTTLDASPSSLPEPMASTSSSSQTVKNQKSGGSNESVTVLLQNLKVKIDEKIGIFSNKQQQQQTTDIFNDNPNNSETDMKTDLLDDIVANTLKSVQQNMDKYVNNEDNEEEMRKAFSKIDTLVDKTEQQSKILKQLESSDTGYKQKVSELGETITELTNENEALQSEVERAEVKGERRGTLKTILYGGLMLMMALGGNRPTQNHDTLVPRNNLVFSNDIWDNSRYALRRLSDDDQTELEINIMAI